jgi:hypothetical protein
MIDNDPLVNVNIKLRASQRNTAVHMGINLSEYFRESLDIKFGMQGADYQMLSNQLIDIRKQMETLQLEEKLVLNQLRALESEETISYHRDFLYTKWHKNLAILIKNNAIDWKHQKELFQFKNISDCKNWMLDKLRNEGLI